MREKVPVESAPAAIDAKIRELGDWRGKMLAAVRKIVLSADREIIEEWKWMGSPVWSHDGIIVVATVLKNKVKLTFSHGARLPDPHKLFNAALEGGTWRAIDLFEGNKINDHALTKLIRAGVEYNQTKSRKKPPAGRPGKSTQKPLVTKHRLILSTFFATRTTPR